MIPVIGDEMKGGGNIDAATENNEWILKLHTKCGEVYQYKDKFSNVLDAMHIKRELENYVGDGGASKLL
ncbi:MAG: hypothetical protein M0Q91_04335 [Methanoregula sp.]|jgi:hypothetical protein|nr:hypothetical protein [Methanoregula sp.]